MKLRNDVDNMSKIDYICQLFLSWSIFDEISNINYEKATTDHVPGVFHDWHPGKRRGFDSP